MKYQVIGRQLWVKEGFDTWSVDLSELDESYRSGAKKKSSSADHITAPMPGKITKIFASLGKEVQPGEVLVVMEAMKMEYTLKSEIKGTVQSLPVQVGAQVGLGDLLVQLKPN